MDQQTQEALNKLHYVDEYPIDVLAKYAGCAESTMYGYVRDIPSGGYRSKYIDALRSTMLQKHRNTRLMAFLFPAGAGISYDDARHDDVNNCIHDENEELTLAQAQMIVTYRANDPDQMEEAIERGEEALRRARREADALRAAQTKLTRAS